MALFDFSLTSEEMSIIDSLDRGQFLNYNPYSSLARLPKSIRNWKGF